MKTKIMPAIFFLALFVGGATAQSSGPRMPFVDKGACPFEGCTYRDWTVDKPTVMRSAMRDGSPVAFRLKNGEKVIGVTGTVITTRAGIVRVLKNTTLDNVKLKRGDNLYLLTYLGEGFSKIWYKGRIFDGDPNDQKLFKEIRKPIDVWWVKVKNGAAKQVGAASLVISGTRISSGINNSLSHNLWPQILSR